MSDLVPPAAAPLWPRIVAIIGLLWSGYGLYLFPLFFEAARAGSIPLWVGLCFVISVVGAMLGSLCLLFLPRWATWLLPIALLADLAWAIGTGSGFLFRLAAVSTLIGLFLLLAAYGARRYAQDL